MTEKISFTNAKGQELAGRLELPVDRHPHNFAIFAHCFTCSKNLSAVRAISRALTGHGFGVLRFDFTGLGESEGDFSDSNFSGNIEDLVSASHYLSKHHKAPALLVGHSLGGAAILYAAEHLSHVKALATIGAPARPDHVKHIFKSKLDKITSEGRATVNIGGRDFTIKKQFVDDLNSRTAPEVVETLDSAILILHSPQDRIVGIRNAEEIYKSARHPKSFITLDGSDHLLNDKADAIYAGRVIAEWAKRYVSIPPTPELQTKHQVVASLDADAGFTTDMKVGSHDLIADEPLSYGGNDFGPSPYELVAAGLSACTAMTIQMYVKRKGWNLENVEVHTSYGKFHAEDCEACDESEPKLDTFNRSIKLFGTLDDKQRNRILEIANKCPVHRTLHKEIQVITKLEM